MSIMLPSSHVSPPHDVNYIFANIKKAVILLGSWLHYFVQPTTTPFPPFNHLASLEEFWQSKIPHHPSIICSLLVLKLLTQTFLLK